MSGIYEKMRIIRSKKQYDVPNVDLLTFLFDSEHSASQDDTVLHVSAHNPSHSITKADLRVFSEEIAHGLRFRYGIGVRGPSKDVVTIMSSGQPMAPAVFFGVIAAGGVFSAASHSFTPQELARQVKQGESNLIICSEDLKHTAIEAAQICGVPTSRVVVFGLEPPWLLPSADGAIQVRSDKRLSFPRITDRDELKNSLIMLLWSSGTTGVPKGVMLSHLNMVAELYFPTTQAREWAQPKIESGELVPKPMITVAHLPIAHIAGIIGYLTVPVLAGATVYWMRKFEWKSFIEYSKKYKITALYTVPSIFLRISKSPDVTDHFQHLEAASTGAALMDEELQKAANAKLGTGATFIGQTWGLSETTGAVTAMPKGEMDDTGSISPVLPNLKLRCVDDNEEDVEPGTPGELVVQGDVVANGYYNNPEATNESFRNGWFFTGDIAVERNGKFYIVDRKKEIFKYKGLQIAPAEIEGLLDAHPRIQEAAVVGVPKSGDGEVPRAYVVADPSEISEEEIQKFVLEKLAPYKQLRGGVVFVKELPKSAINKILRRELRERAKLEMRTSKL